MNGFFGLLSCYSFSCGEHAFPFMNGSFLFHMNGMAPFSYERLAPFIKTQRFFF